MQKTVAFLHIVINYQRIQKTISFKIASKSISKNNSTHSNKLLQREFRKQSRLKLNQKEHLRINKGDEKLYSDKNKI